MFGFLEQYLICARGPLEIIWFVVRVSDRFISRLFSFFLYCVYAEIPQRQLNKKSFSYEVAVISNAIMRNITVRVISLLQSSNTRLRES